MNPAITKASNLLPQKTTAQWKIWWRSLGPGIITAAIVFGPSKITIASKLGAGYEHVLLWLVVVAIFFMIVFTSMATRIGAATDRSLLQIIRTKWGKGAALIVGLGIFLVTASFQAGNSIGVGIAVAELTHTSSVIWIIVFNVAGICLLFFRGFYSVLEKIMITLITIMLLAFIITLVMIRPDITKIAAGFIPSIPAGSTGIITAFIASCFSIVAAFYQSYLIQERIRLHPGSRKTIKLNISGMVILGLLVSIVMICAATVLHPKGIMVNTAVDMGKALEPLFGKYAELLFLVGLFGASFSALLGNATIGGTLLGDALGYGYQLQNKSVKYLIAAVMILGASVAIIFGKLPIQLIILAQSVTIFIVPFIGFALFAVANDSRIMGTAKNNLYYKVMGAAGLALVVFLALMNAMTLFF